MTRRAWIVWLAVSVATAAMPLRIGAQPPIEPPTLRLDAAPELAGVAARIARLDAARMTTVMRLLGLTDAGPPIVVHIEPERSEIARQTPGWVGGFADTRGGRIVLFPERTPSYPYESLDDLLHHEVAHVLIARAARGAPVPRWFHEGLAMAAERSWGLEDRARLAMAVVGGHRSLREIEDDFGHPDRVARAYGVTAALVRDLLGRHEAGWPAALLARLAEGEPFDQAFARSTGVSLAEAERRFWRESWWYQVVPFLTSTLVLWMATVLLALWAIGRRLRRRAARRRQWDEEERRHDAISPDLTAPPGSPS